MRVLSLILVAGLCVGQNGTAPPSIIKAAADTANLTDTEMLAIELIVGKQNEINEKQRAVNEQRDKLLAEVCGRREIPTKECILDPAERKVKRAAAEGAAKSDKK